MTERIEFTSKVGEARTAAAGLRSTQDVVFVDVGSRAIESRVVRDGIPIGALKIDPDVLADVVVQRPVVNFRVVGQSIAAGTPVPQGTTVDVTLARPGQLPIGVVTGVHRDLKELTVEEGFSRFVNPATRRVLARTAAGPLSSEDEQTIKDVFRQNDVTVGDEPGRDVGAALETLRMLSTFGGA